MLSRSVIPNSANFCAVARSLLIHGIFQAKILECAAIFLLKGIFPTQGSNPRLLCLLHCGKILYPGKPHRWELVGLCQAVHTLHLASLVNAGDSDTALALSVSYQLSLAAN